MDPKHERKNSNPQQGMSPAAAPWTPTGGGGGNVSNNPSVGAGTFPPPPQQQQQQQPPPPSYGSTSYGPPSTSNTPPTSSNFSNSLPSPAFQHHQQQQQQQQYGSGGGGGYPIPSPLQGPSAALPPPAASSSSTSSGHKKSTSREESSESGRTDPSNISQPQNKKQLQEHQRTLEVKIVKLEDELKDSKTRISDLQSLLSKYREKARQHNIVVEVAQQSGGTSSPKAAPKVSNRSSSQKIISVSDSLAGSDFDNDDNYNSNNGGISGGSVELDLSLNQHPGGSSSNKHRRGDSKESSSYSNVEKTDFAVQVGDPQAILESSLCIGDPLASSRSGGGITSGTGSPVLSALGTSGNSNSNGNKNSSCGGDCSSGNVQMLVAPLSSIPSARPFRIQLFNAPPPGLAQIENSSGNNNNNSSIPPSPSMQSSTNNNSGKQNKNSQQQQQQQSSSSGILGRGMIGQQQLQIQTSNSSNFVPPASLPVPTVGSPTSGTPGRWADDEDDHQYENENQETSENSNNFQPSSYDQQQQQQQSTRTKISPPMTTTTSASNSTNVSAARGGRSMMSLRRGGGGNVGSQTL